jgi:hypothetical protein
MLLSIGSKTMRTTGNNPKLNEWHGNSAGTDTCNTVVGSVSESYIEKGSGRGGAEEKIDTARAGSLVNVAL